MYFVSIVAAVIVVSCPDRIPATEGARVLASAPGLSNRTNVFQTPDRPHIVFAPTTPSRMKTVEPKRLDGTPASQPPQVYGIPYPWTPMTWAILHSGGSRSR
jgi:hypothetical protein